MKEVKVLGTGCAKCNKLYKQVEDVIQKEGISDVELGKVTDLDEIMDYGVMMTPALVIDGEVKASGKIPSEDKIASWLK